MRVCCQWHFLLSCNWSNIQKNQTTTKHTNKNGLWGVKLGCNKWEEITPPLYHIIFPSLFLLSVLRLFLTKLPKLALSPLITHTSLGFISFHFCLLSHWDCRPVSHGMLKHSLFDKIPWSKNPFILGSYSFSHDFVPYEISPTIVTLISFHKLILHLLFTDVEHYLQNSFSLVQNTYFPSWMCDIPAM